VTADPLTCQVYCPFLWPLWPTGWYTLRALRTPTLVLTNERQCREQWPWPDDGVVEWDFSGETPDRLREVQVVHVHTGWTLSSVGLELQRRLAGAAFVATVIGTDVNVHACAEEVNPLYRSFFERAHAIVAISEFLARKLELVGCPPERIRVIPLAVEPGALAVKRPEEFSPAGTLRACIVARLIDWKGIEDAMHATALARRLGADVTLDVIGVGPKRDELAALAAELGPFITLRSSDDETAHSAAMATLAKADCVLNCSRRLADGSEESLGVSLIEGQTIGLPALAFASGGVGEIVVDGETGMLLEPTAEALAHAMAALADDRDRRVELGARGRAEAIRRFSARVVAGRLEELYREAAAA
jgi:glycosyltransferase involved in cell wall biosynthesis